MPLTPPSSTTPAPRIAVKLADTARNDNTITADPELRLLALPAGTWSLEGYIATNGFVDAVNGWRGTILSSQALASSRYNIVRAPAGTLNYQIVLADSVPSIIAAGARVDDATGNACTALVTGYLILPSATDISFQWAEVATGNPATVLAAGSWLRAFKLA